MITNEITQENLYLLLPSKVSCIANIIQEKENKQILDAVKEVYLSDTYHKLEIESTKLWHLGPVALYREMTS